MKKWYPDEELHQREAMCDECMSEGCAYVAGGLCHFPLVFGKEPVITEDGGCADYLWDEIH